MIDSFRIFGTYIILLYSQTKAKSHGYLAIFLYSSFVGWSQNLLADCRKQVRGMQRLRLRRCGNVGNHWDFPRGFLKSQSVKGTKPWLISVTPWPITGGHEMLTDCQWHYSYPTHAAHFLVRSPNRSLGMGKPLGIWMMILCLFQSNYLYSRLGLVVMSPHILYMISDICRCILIDVVMYYCVISTNRWDLLHLGPLLFTFQ